jgi:uncharacterized membrane protein YvbJ
MKKYKTTDSKIADKGVSARDKINKDELIGPWCSRDKTQGRILNDEWAEVTSLGRYVNHSDNPNTYTELIEDTVYLFAKDDIKPKEELTADYRDAYTYTGFWNENVLGPKP